MCEVCTEAVHSVALWTRVKHKRAPLHARFSTRWHINVHTFNIFPSIFIYIIFAHMINICTWYAHQNMYHGYSRYIKIICTYIKKDSRIVLIILNGDSTSCFPDVEYFFRWFLLIQEKDQVIWWPFGRRTPKQHYIHLVKNPIPSGSLQKIQDLYMYVLFEKWISIAMLDYTTSVLKIIPSWLLCHPFWEVKRG